MGLDASFNFPAPPEGRGGDFSLDILFHRITYGCVGFSACPFSSGNPAVERHVTLLLRPARFLADLRRR
jgi:hypothetical protein